MMNIVEATSNYEEWLARRIPLIEADLEEKHARMADNLFEFMRATFYRWMQLWLAQLSDLAIAPVVLAVGDLHTDNYGTWRDIEARFVWGINDFDEAYPLAYTTDLVRLATSVSLAITEGSGSIDMKDVSDAVLSGYKDSLRRRGEPFVLAENNAHLRDLLLDNIKEPERFWEKLEELPTLSKQEQEAVPQEAVLAIEENLPEPGLRYRLSHRTAGLGSLGRRRFQALMKLCGSNAAREAKELTASSCLWALEDQQWGGGSSLIYYSEILRNAVRCRDPFLRVRDRWVVRRLSPDYVRLDIALLSTTDLERVLYDMGWETANVHLGSGRDAAREVRQDLRDRGEDWLVTAAEQMLELTADDFSDWQDYWNDGEV
jgi:Uncharacterized protein conserved in bacteria (DUF2252)